MVRGDQTADPTSSSCLRLKRHFIRLAEHREFLANRLLPVLHPAGELPVHERLDLTLVRPRAEPVTGLLAVALEIPLGERLESTPTDLAEVLDPVPPERLAPAC